MNYLARLKNLKGTDTHTTKPTEPRFVGFVAPIRAPFENSRGVLSEVGRPDAGPETLRSVATVAVVIPENLSAANDPASPKALEPQSAPAPEPADWQALDKAYQAHHVNCPACIAAGKGYGLRCGTGAALWAEYDAADMPMYGKVSARARTEAAPRHSWDAHAIDQPPLSDAEQHRNAARLALFDARGLSVDDAERLADKLLTRDREGDHRGVCAECRQLVGHGPGRWKCNDQSPVSFNDLAGLGVGAEFVHHQLHHCPSREVAP